MIPRALLFAFTIAHVASAQGKPTLVDYPLDVKVPMVEAKLNALQDDFRLLLARSPALRVSTKTSWKAATAALKRQDCDVRDECLQQLATTAGTLYALYASVEQNAAATEVTVTGRVVNQDGQQVRAPVTMRAPRSGPLHEAAHAALTQLLAALELEKLSAVLTPPAEAKPPPEAPRVADAPTRPAEPLVLVLPSLPASPPERPLSGVRVGAFVAGGAAVAAAGVAVGFGLTASALRSSLPSDGQLRDEAQVRAQRQVNEGATIALVSAAAAGALVGTAVALFVGSAPPPDAPVVSVAPFPGGGQVTLSGGLGR